MFALSKCMNIFLSFHSFEWSEVGSRSLPAQHGTLSSRCPFESWMHVISAVDKRFRTNDRRISPILIAVVPIAMPHVYNHQFGTTSSQKYLSKNEENVSNVGNKLMSTNSFLWTFQTSRWTRTEMHIQRVSASEGVISRGKVVLFLT